MINHFDDLSAKSFSDESVGEGVIAALAVFFTHCVWSASSRREDGTAKWTISHDEILGVFLEFGDKKEIMGYFATAFMTDEGEISITIASSEHLGDSVNH